MRMVEEFASVAEAEQFVGSARLGRVSRARVVECLCSYPTIGGAHAMEWLRACLWDRRSEVRMYAVRAMSAPSRWGDAKGDVLERMHVERDELVLAESLEAIERQGGVQASAKWWRGWMRHRSVLVRAACYDVMASMGRNQPVKLVASEVVLEKSELAVVSAAAAMVCSGGKHCAFGKMVLRASLGLGEPYQAVIRACNCIEACIHEWGVGELRALDRRLRELLENEYKKPVTEALRRLRRRVREVSPLPK